MEEAVDVQWVPTVAEAEHHLTAAVVVVAGPGASEAVADTLQLPAAAVATGVAAELATDIGKQQIRNARKIRRPHVDGVFFCPPCQVTQHSAL
jgi:hypothetical protein